VEPIDCGFTQRFLAGKRDLSELTEGQNPLNLAKIIEEGNHYTFNDFDLDREWKALHK